MANTFYKRIKDISGEGTVTIGGGPQEPNSNALQYYFYWQAGGVGQGFAVQLSPDNSTWHTVVGVNGYSNTAVISCVVTVPAGWYFQLISIGGASGRVNYIAIST